MSDIPQIVFDDEFEHAYVKPTSKFYFRGGIDYLNLRSVVKEEYEKINPECHLHKAGIKNIGLIDMIYSEEGITGDRLIPLSEGIKIVKMIECEIHPKKVAHE